VKLDWTGKVLAMRDTPNHTGDIVFHDDNIYTALAVLPGNKEGRIQVYDRDLNFVREKVIDRAIDGIACADGVLYVGMGAKEQPSANPHRVNVLGRFDAKTLEEIAPRAEFDYGHKTRYGFQDIVYDGRNILAAVYAVCDDAGCGVAVLRQRLRQLGVHILQCQRVGLGVGLSFTISGEFILQLGYALRKSLVLATQHKELLYIKYRTLNTTYNAVCARENLRLGVI
jgi:hypothetical protein